MTCQEAVEYLPDYLDRQLSAGVLRLVEAHLDGCGACRARLEASRSAAAVLEEVPATTAGGLPEEVGAAMRAARRRRGEDAD